MRVRMIAAAAAAAGMLLLAGCSPADDGMSGTDATDSLTVFAAASLTDAFDDLAAGFAEENPKVDVAPVVYDGSSTLVTQLSEGARADVLATADEANMQDTVDDGLATDPRLFATNTLVIAVPAGNPGDVSGLDDLPDVTTVLCAPGVPCGTAAGTLLDNQDVEVEPASLEQNVTSVLTKVAAGEADAGLVYATDVVGEEAVESIVPDGAADVVNRYPIVALDGASNAGRAFVDYVLSDDGRAVLAEYGFGAP